MSGRSGTGTPGGELRGNRVLSACLCLISCIGLAYANGLATPFVYDDLLNVAHNASIRSLSPPWAPFFASPNTATAGRPLVNWTFALNYALSGTNSWSYHLFNVLVHAAAALTLFGLARRSFAMPALEKRYAGQALGLGFATALIWSLHPVLTGAVTYVSQRTESMMGLFLFLTLYAAVRGWKSEKTRRAWHVAAVFFCLLGVGAKEVIVAAPVLVWLYDVLLRGRGWFGALRESPLLYGGLALCMTPLALLVASGGTARSGALDSGLGAWGYLLTQAQVVAHYLWIMVWPPDAAFDYVWPAPTLAGAWVELTFLALLAAAGVWGAARRSVWSYPVLWFFIVLAPTSSVMPMMFPACPYRLYVPLAAVAALVVAGGWELAWRLFPREGKRVAAFSLFILAATLGTGTVLANAAYQDPLLLWRETARKQPGNHRAQHWVGSILLERGFVLDSIPLFRQALELRPDYARARGALGRALLQTGQLDEAQDCLQGALRIAPGLIVLHKDLGLLYYMRGEYARAVEELERYARNRPGDASANQVLERARERL